MRASHQRVVAQVAALLVVGAAQAAGPGPEGKPMSMRKQDFVPPVFAAGPSVEEPRFPAWLRAQGVVKLPFTIWRQPRRVAAIGVHARPPPEVLRLSDSALGIPLDERLRHLCAAEEPCRVWLSGRLGEALPVPGEDPAAVFSVHAVHERVEGNGPHAAASPRGAACLVIRALKPLHCARGPGRCEKCKAAEAQPAVPRLLDVCPWGDAARPTVEVEREGKKQGRAYDVLRSFADEAEARAFAQQHGLTDAQYR